MKRFVFLFIVFLYCGDNIYSQDVFDEFLKGRSKDLVSFYGEQEEKIRMFSEKQNAEFANFRLSLRFPPFVGRGIPDAPHDTGSTYRPQ